MGFTDNVEFSDIKKHKNLALNISIIILAFIVSLNIYKKQNKEILSLNAQKEIEIKKNAEFDTISGLEKKNNYFKNYLSKKDAGLTINTITNIAKELGIKIVSIRPESELKFAQYIKEPFEISFVINSYHDLGKFVSKMESSNNVYVIEIITAKYGTKENGLLINLRLSSIAVN